MRIYNSLYYCVRTINIKRIKIKDVIIVAYHCNVTTKEQFLDSLANYFKNKIHDDDCAEEYGISPGCELMNMYNKYKDIACKLWDNNKIITNTQVYKDIDDAIFAKYIIDKLQEVK